MIRDAEGVYVRDVDGNEYLDFTAASHCMHAGHRQPAVIDAIKRELDRVVHWYDLLTPTKVEFLRELNSVTPEQIDCFQMYSTGSETVEAALRLAQSYRGTDGFISLNNSFHGKTLAARSLTDTPFSRQFGTAPGFYHTETAYCYRCPLGLRYPSCEAACADVVEEVYTKQARGRVAALVLEPIQGSDTIVLPPEFMHKMEAFCRRHSLLFICDEILAGMGRSGVWWSHELSGVRPDIVTIGKGISSGIPLGVVASSRDIMSRGPFAEPGHSSTTFGGSTVAEAAALATIKVYHEHDLIANSRAMGAHMKGRLLELMERYPVIGDVRGEGLLLTLELVTDRKSKRRVGVELMRALFDDLLRGGVLVAVRGTGLCLTPPLVVTRTQVDAGLEVVETAVAELQRRVDRAA